MNITLIPLVPHRKQPPPFQYKLRIMETCQKSSPASTGPEASPAQGQHIDLTEDLAQQLEDIISTYQAAEIPAEPEDTEEVTSIKEADARKDPKLEKKMLKNLGVLGFFSLQNVVLISAEVGFIQLGQQKLQMH